MSPAKRGELIRRQLYREKMEESFEEDFVKNIVLVAREMGWTIEYILDMGICRFIRICEVLLEFSRSGERLRGENMLTEKLGGIRWQ